MRTPDAMKEDPEFDPDICPDCHGIVDEDCICGLEELNAAPVLAEPRASCDGNQHGQTHTGEARESIVITDIARATDSRGGVQNLTLEQTESLTDWYDHKPEDRFWEEAVQFYPKRKETE